MSHLSRARSPHSSPLSGKISVLPRTMARAMSKYASTTEAAAGVERINMLLVNAYLLGDRGANDRQWILVDAGVALSASCIMAAAEKRFGCESRPAAIILTHGHFDHMGALPQLADSWDVPIYCHRLEVPYLSGRSSYPPPDPGAGGGMMSVMSRFFPRGPYDFQGRLQALPENGAVPGAPRWRWIHTPGHAPGHVALFRDDDHSLIAGDAFVCTQQESLLAVLLQKAKICRPPAYYTPDWPAARRSVERLLALQPVMAATGHGPPIFGAELQAGLRKLLFDWAAEAVPRGGRYSVRPAIADGNGTKSVPPASHAATMQVVVTLGVAAIIGASLLLLRRGTSAHSTDTIPRDPGS